MSLTPTFMSCLVQIFSFCNHEAQTTELYDQQPDNGSFFFFSLPLPLFFVLKKAFTPILRPCKFNLHSPFPPFAPLVKLAKSQLEGGGIRFEDQPVG